MSFKIACQANEKAPCFEVSGEIANHLDSIGRYISAKADDRHGVVLDIRPVTIRPSADKLFIHVLKYPAVCSRKIALVDLTENRRFWSVYKQLVCTRGYQVHICGEVKTAIEWLLSDRPVSEANRSRIRFLTQLPAILLQSLNPMNLVHAKPGLSNFLFGTLPTIWR